MNFSKRDSGSRESRQGKCMITRVVMVLVVSFCFVGKSRAAVEVGPEHSFEAGHSVDICVNPLTGQPHIIWESLGGEIRYTYYTGSEWAATVTVPGPTNVGCYDDTGRIADDIGLTMEIDSSGYIHIAYVTNNTTIYHIHQTASGWSMPVLVHDGGTSALSWVNLDCGGGFTGSCPCDLQQEVRR